MLHDRAVDSPGSESRRSRLSPLLRTLKETALNTSEHGERFSEVATLALWSSAEYGTRIDRIWQWDDWPDADGVDTGVDLVVRTIDGELWAVQARGYSETTSITYGGLATFLVKSGTGKFSQRFLITSTNKIGSTARKEMAAQPVEVKVLDRDWLDDLDLDWPSDIAGLRAAVEAASNGTGAAACSRARGRRDLLDHQEAAVAEVLHKFTKAASARTGRSDIRAKLLMACGTGKTLTCHAIAEELHASHVLVLVPSLALLAQVMRDWLAQSQGRLDVIAVCSDHTVGIRGYDEITIDRTQVPARVTTNPTDIASFLTQGHQEQWPKVVFSTYHSCPAVAAAQQLLTRGGPAVESGFDLLIADEAHYLAGRVHEDFATALDNNKIRARHRLFATATPRIVSTRARDTLAADGQDHGVVSMDDPAVFGEVAHELPFSEAIAEKLLTDYQLLILGVDKEEIAEQIDHRALLRLQENGIATDAASLAAAVAIHRVVTQYGGRRLVSYHSRIAGADNFAALLGALPEWLATVGPPSTLWAKVVHGAMPTNKRRALLRYLAEDGQGEKAKVITNARCLTEGVDIPTLDGVVFVDPRRSKIDIVQAVGRAMRRADHVNKTCGLIIVPVVVRQDESAQRALSGSAFESVWEVLGALRDHDNSLADEIDALRNELGRRGSIPRDALSKIVIDLPVGSDFADAIRLRMVERTSSSFDYYLGALIAYVEREGHALVPARYVDENNVALGAWVNKQRTARNSLTSRRRARLEEVPGWTWNVRDARFEKHVAAYRRFVTRHNHGQVPAQYVDDNNIRLGQWVNVQRTNRYQHSPDRFALLEALPCWTWDVAADSFEKTFAALEAYVQRTGTSRVPPNYVDENGVKLGRWVIKRRNRRKYLTPEQQKRFEALPEWAWDARGDLFAKTFAAVEAYARRTGTSLIPDDYVDDDGIRLGSWVGKQRALFKKGALPPEQRALLEALPCWTWDLAADSFDKAFAALEAYVQRTGSSRVPARYVDGEGVKVGRWVANQRHRRKRLSPEQQKRFEALPCWTWSVNSDSFDENLAALTAFAKREGHARVPQKHVENGTELGAWVGWQRQRYRKGTLPTAQQAKLESVDGWVWDARLKNMGRTSRQ